MNTNDISSAPVTTENEAINDALTEVLYRSGPMGIIAAWLIASIVFYCLKKENATDQLGLWYSAMSIVTFLRLGAAGLYFYNKNLRVLHRTLFVVLCTLAGILWGILNSILIPIDNSQLQTLIGTVSAGVPAASVVSLQGAPKTCILFNTFVLIPYVYFCLMQSSLILNCLSVIALLYYFFFVIFAFKSNKILISSLKTNQHNSALIKKLSYLNDRLISANQGLEEAKQVSEVASKTKSNFVANMSHELRTPLNAILGYAELLQEADQNKIDSSNMDKVKKIISASNHLRDIINDILDMSKIESGKTELFLEKIDLQSLCAELNYIMQPLIEKSANHFSVILDPKAEAEAKAIQSDVTKIKQCLINLLSNANKFTTRGEVCLDIKYRSEHGEEVLLFIVRDSGIGIPADKITTLFQPFSQVDSSISRRFGGTGLGLYITQQYCIMLGVKLTVESQEGKGTTFTMHLPTKPPFVAKLENNSHFWPAN